MEKLETLLNTLIARGWKPWGIKADFSEYKFGKFRFIKMSGEIVRMCTLRDLVSLESGLWQFVCKNNLYKKEANNFRENVSKVGNNIGWFNHNYQYRLIESALLLEKELEEFLLDNIIVKGNSK